jgi:hypothetical protein
VFSAQHMFIPFDHWLTATHITVLLTAHHIHVPSEVHSAQHGFIQFDHWLTDTPMTMLLYRYQVKRASDGMTRDISPLSPGGFANSSAQDAFCSGTTCVFWVIYDQSPKGAAVTTIHIPLSIITHHG